MKKRLITLSKTTAAMLLAAAAFTLFSCDDDAAKKLSFEDVYGRKEWKVISDYPSGYFYIDRSKDLSLEKLSGSSPLEGGTQPEEPTPDSYRITLNGTDPYIATQRLLTMLPTANAPVLSFKYKSNRAVNMDIALNTTEKTVDSKLFTLEQAADEKEYSFDLTIMIEKGGWGDVASNFVISFEQNDGAVIEIKDIRLRPYNVEEAGRFYLYGKSSTLSADYEDITEYDTPSMQAFTLTGNGQVGGGFVWQAQFQVLFTSLVTERLTPEMHYLTFEYKCGDPVPSSGDPFFGTLFLVNESLGPQGAPEIKFRVGWDNPPGNGVVAYSKEWQKETIDLNTLTNTWGGGRFSDLYAPFYPLTPRAPRFGMSTGDIGRPTSFRGMHLHK